MDGEYFEGILESERGAVKIMSLLSLKCIIIEMKVFTLYRKCRCASELSVGKS